MALYFYHAKYANHNLTETLKFAKTKNNDKFEVVLIYVVDPGLCDWKSNSKELFWEVFKTMPWLALPFRDECCRKLRRVFKLLYNYEEDPNELVIIGPHAELVEPHGASILLEYGISAYPFTFKKALELETEKIKHLKLEMLWDMNTVFRRNNGSQVSYFDLLVHVLNLLSYLYLAQTKFSEKSIVEAVRKLQFTDTQLIASIVFRLQHFFLAFFPSRLTCQSDSERFPFLNFLGKESFWFLKGSA